MSVIGVLYHSQTGNTEEMAQEVVKGVREADSEAKIVFQKAEKTTPDQMLKMDAIIVGSPTYFGLPASEVKDLFDRSIVHYGKFEGKIGGAFASSGNRGGGTETTIIAILEMMLIHGMIVKGVPRDGHFGPVAFGEPDKKAKEECRRLGERTVKLLEKVRS